MSRHDALCTYCGDFAFHRDHVPPKCWRRALIVQRARYEFKTVPACADCNQILGGHPLFTVAERRAFIRSYLWGRHKKLIESPTWSEREMAELGWGLRTFVKGKDERKRHVLKRLGMLR